MNEKMSFKMGVKCAASFYMGKDFLDVWCNIIDNKLIMVGCPSCNSILTYCI